MNRTRWIGLVAVLAIGVVGFVWWSARARGAAPKFRTAEAERGAVESVVSATGTVRPVVQVAVGSQVSGTVAKLFADYNSRVRAGQVICQLEPSAFRARALQSEAAVARAQAAVRDAERILSRARELHSQNYISKAELDGAEVTLEQRQADVKQARAQLEAARVDLANTTIRAPINGVVISRSIDLGQTVAASLQAPTLFVIANDLSQMQVETRIDEADIGRIHAGLPVSFTVDAFPDLSFAGRVEQVRLEPITEQGVVTYTTVIRTDNPDLKLRPGMTANVTVLIEKREGVLKVPNAALRFRPPSNGKRQGHGGEAMASAGREGRGERGPSAATPGGSPAAGRAPGSIGGGSGRKGAAQRESLKPGTVYVLRDGKPTRVVVMTGLSDGAFTEVRGQALRPGDAVIVGLEVSARGPNLQPPPGMGGQQGFGGGRGRR